MKQQDRDLVVLGLLSALGIILVYFSAVAFFDNFRTVGIVSIEDENQVVNHLTVVDDLLYNHLPGMPITLQSLMDYSKRPYGDILQPLTHLPALDKKTEAERDIQYRLQLLDLRTKLVRDRVGLIANRKEANRVSLDAICFWLSTVFTTPLLVFFGNGLLRRFFAAA